MYLVIAIAIVGLLALGLVAHGARIRRIPERRDRAGRYFLLGGALMTFSAVLLVLQRSGA
ncbi:hypothetical protein T8S45_13550 [Blastomonas marina]|uniref:Uncharacterized protein n=1 Tax=Blastomonas marina TaxID=1867408 RepID=A0ABQ1F2Y3_9SPHN|nr:hypothetical protein [Blastomonas marina]WPZ03835.1 hypothetical protein T8S45_13550 [Blastomonas marina]GFZ97865.1 hypothetical protein GCM10010923_02400 [Blastomonas marina]